MKHILYLLFIILNLLINQFSASAQKFKDFDLLNDNIESMLPPLESLIDSAIVNNPTIKSGDLQTLLKEYKLKTDRKLWIKNIGLQSDVRYGTINNFSSNTGDGQTPVLSGTQSNSFNYGVGASLKIPIYEAFSRKNMIRSDQLEIEQAQNQSLAQRNELRLTVINLYNDLILKHRIFLIKSRYAETVKINMQLAEKGFQNGVLTLENYSSACESFARSEADFESIKMDFRTAYMTLEEVVGIPFNKIQ